MALHRAPGPDLSPRIPCDPAAIPDDLRAADRWGVWRPAPDRKKPGKTKKLPLNPRTGDAARSNDLATWASYAEAVAAYEADESLAGLGFLLGDGWAGVDLDGCRDPETGAIAEWARRWVDQSPSYAEVSPSGTGVKIIVRASMSRAMKHILGDHVSVEVYGPGRYFTVTGARLATAPPQVNEAQQFIDDLIRAYRPEQADPAPPPAPPAHPPIAPTPTAPPAPAVPAHGWRATLAVAVDLEWRAWVAKKLDQAVARMRAEPAGGLHHARIREARLLGGVIAAAPGYLTADEAVDALFRARPPESHAATEHKALRDGLAMGLRDPIPPQDGPEPPTDAEPTLDSRGRASCPDCDTPLRRSQYDYPGTVTPGWYCPQCKHPNIWPLEAVIEPIAPSVAPGDDTPAPPVGLLHRTDLGNAARMVRDHGGVIRYVAEWDKWVVWDGVRWKIDITGAVKRLARDTVRGIYQEASEAGDDDVRKALAKWAAASESKGRLDAMVALAQHEPGIPLAAETLDADPWLICCANGAVDLRTGAMLPPRRDRLQTKVLAAPYDPTAAAPRWEAFLAQIFQGDAELLRYVQQAAGYTLTGVTSEQCMFFLFGGGQNGKSTFINALFGLLADYARKTPTDTLMARKQAGGVPNDIARLRGARMVVAAELEDGARLKESVVKDLVSDDMISARFLHQEFFDFTPSHKLWMYGNHKPHIRGTDDGIWRRMRLIPFTVRLDDAQKDKRLGEALRAEWPGILAWAVRGCLDWQAHGLITPAAVVEATAQYRSEMDQLQNFFDECCVIQPRVRTRASQLYAAYVRWCEDAGERRVLAKQKFGAELAARGYAPARSGGVSQWEGIGLRDDARTDPRRSHDEED